MKPIEVALWSLAGFVVATIASEWALREIWPADYPSQCGEMGGGTVARSIPMMPTVNPLWNANPGR